MFFYVDESGHTGPNLFDPAQPVLGYGLLQSRTNLDVLAEPVLSKLRKKLGVGRLHAAELGNKNLTKIVPEILKLRRKHDLRFLLCRVAKPDHAIICFFDQVFDQGVNPAVTWTGYWTPLRYVLLVKLASLFDEDMAKKAWTARITIDDQVSHPLMVEVCESLLSRIPAVADERSREILGDALGWAMANPAEIHYNVTTKADILQITPNVIGFQSVMSGIASKVKQRGRQPSRIIVDQQTQFNKAQRTLADFYKSARNAPMINGPGLPEIDFTGMPTTPIQFCSGEESAGLELVDIYLWAFNRLLDKKELAPELRYMLHDIGPRTKADEISLNAIMSRWTKWFEELPDVTAEEIEKGREILAMDETRRLNAILDS